VPEKTFSKIRFGSGLSVVDEGDHVITVYVTTTLTFDIPTVGGKFMVRDSSGASIFEVWDDGSVHIKTGTSILADL